VHESEEGGKQKCGAYQGNRPFRESEQIGDFFEVHQLLGIVAQHGQETEVFRKQTELLECGPIGKQAGKADECSRKQRTVHRARGKGSPVWQPNSKQAVDADNAGDTSVGMSQRSSAVATVISAMNGGVEIFKKNE
jgi:hypothetical protein